jgi:Tfp pilus assembly protein PilX
MKPLPHRRRRTDSQPVPNCHSQQGLILFVALIVLVALTLSGLALMRSSGTGLLIAGNLSFRQSGVSVADYGSEAARSWLLSQGRGNLYDDNNAQGYFATQGAAAEFDYANHAWSNNSQTVTPQPDAATTVRWVMHRLCSNTGSPADSGQTCVTTMPASSTAGSSKNVLSSSQRALSTLGAQSVLYRVTTRVEGPRNTVAYTQVVIY